MESTLELYFAWLVLLVLAVFVVIPAFGAVAKAFDSEPLTYWGCFVFGTVVFCIFSLVVAFSFAVKWAVLVVSA